MSHERIHLELARLKEGGQEAALVTADRDYIQYQAVPTAGEPSETDVLVPVPGGYPAGMIDLAGLPTGSPLLSRVMGGSNPQGAVTTPDGRHWTLASYHPHQGGGGPKWDPMEHGFHTYIDHLLSWLAKIN